MADPTEFEWSYLAGILDGEGSISLQIKTDRAITCALNIRVRIANTSKDLMDWIHERFGGNLTVACKEGFHGTARPVYANKVLYQLAWYSRSEVTRILNGMMPYLIIKSWVAESVVSLIQLPKDMIMEKLNLTNLIKEVQHGI